MCLRLLCLSCFPSVLWYCWLGLLTCKTVSQVTSTVLVETLNPAHSLTRPRFLASTPECVPGEVSAIRGWSGCIRWYEMSSSRHGVCVAVRRRWRARREVGRSVGLMKNAAALDRIDPSIRYDTTARWTDWLVATSTCYWRGIDWRLRQKNLHCVNTACSLRPTRCQDISWVAYPIQAFDACTVAMWVQL